MASDINMDSLELNGVPQHIPGPADHMFESLMKKNSPENDPWLSHVESVW